MHPDIAHPSNRQDPYRAYRWLRTHDPVRWSESLRMWVVTRYEDVRTILQDSTHYSVDRFGRGASTERDGVAEIGELLRDWTVYRDPPDHTRLRKVLAASFSVNALRSLRPRVQRVVDDLIAPLTDRKSIDFVREFAFPLPASIIAAILGVPDEDLPLIKVWSDQLARYVGGVRGADNLEQAQRGLSEMCDYFRILTRARDRNLGTDAVSVMVDARRNGRMRDDDEVVANCVLLIFAGHETTTNLLGNGLFHLLDHPDQLAVLRAQPELVPGAVEELLRFDTPVSGTIRIAIDDVDLRGRCLRAGDAIAVFLASANRDPEWFDAPEELVVSRASSHHFSFGLGAHFCLGAGLARLEAQLGFSSVLSRFPSLRLLDEAPRWKPQVFFRGLQGLSVELGKPIRAATAMRV